MNDATITLVKVWIYGLTRAGLGATMTWLVAKGIVTQEVSAETVSAIAAGLFSLLQTAWERWKRQQAIEAEKAKTEAQTARADSAEAKLIRATGGLNGN